MFFIDEILTHHCGNRNKNILLAGALCTNTFSIYATRGLHDTSAAVVLLPCSLLETTAVAAIMTREGKPVLDCSCTTAFSQSTRGTEEGKILRKYDRRWVPVRVSPVGGRALCLYRIELVDLPGSGSVTETQSSTVRRTEPK